MAALHWFCSAANCVISIQSFFTTLPLGPGLTQIVNTPNGVFFYNGTTGAAVFGEFDIDGNYEQTNNNPGSFSTGWSQIVNTPNGVFFYRSATGVGAFGRFDVNGTYLQTNSNPGTFTTGWSQIISLPTGGVLWYNGSSGLTQTGLFDSTGTYSFLQAHNFALGWSRMLSVR